MDLGQAWKEKRCPGQIWHGLSIMHDNAGVAMKLLCISAAIVTMQHFVWQLEIVGVAHFVMDGFVYLDAANSSNQP
jgi:hypothetical protein